MKINDLITLFFLGISIFFTSCEDPDPDDNDNQNNTKVRYITDDIDATEIWYSDTVYVVDVYNLSVEAALTIQAGTVVKFKSENGMNVLNGGSLQAIGTAEAPIIFTAFNDDQFGGDVNNDAAATVPAKGYWGGIQFESVASSSLSYCKVFYAGADNPNGGGPHCAIMIEHGATNLSFNHCTFAHTSGNGSSDEHCAVKVLSPQLSDFVFENNAIYDNGGTVVLSEAVLAARISNTNIFHDPANAAIKNVRQGFFIYDFSFTQNIALSITEIPYVFDIVQGIDDGITITLADHVIINLHQGLNFLIEVRVEAAL